MRLLMCRPDYYSVIYEINPWMNTEIDVDHHKALQQWQQLTQTISECGIKIELIEPVAALPDMVFTANAALIKNNIAYLSHFYYPQRQGESAHNYEWFSKHNMEVNTVADREHQFFEGEGDALFAGANTLFAGYGFRSQKSYYHYLEKTLGVQVIYCELINPYFYHLDTCFCPLDENTAIWWPDAFSSASQQTIKKAINVIDVAEHEAKKFCCNAIVYNKNVIIPAGCELLQKELELRGYTVHCCEMSEFIKAGGACKCLSLILD